MPFLHALPLLPSVKSNAASTTVSIGFSFQNGKSTFGSSKLVTNHHFPFACSPRPTNNEIAKCHSQCSKDIAEPILFMSQSSRLLVLISQNFVVHIFLLFDGSLVLISVLSTQFFLLLESIIIFSYRHGSKVFRTFRLQVLPLQGQTV